VCEAVGDHRADIQTGLKHHGHLVPGFVHFTTVDTLQRKHVKYDRAPVDDHIPIGNTEDGDPRSVAHVGEHFGKCRWTSGHLEPDIEALSHPKALLDIPEAPLAYVHRQGHAHLHRQLQTARVDVRDHDEAGAGM